MNNNKLMENNEPKNQLKLYGYENYFYSFKNLYEKKKLPNIILLSGQKGLGKSTFAYHFINYLLSQNDENKYSLDNFTIDSNNSTFKLIQQQIHPNFTLLDSDTAKENIKIEQVRNLLKLLSKSTYSKNLKIVLIDNAEYLNLNSSNALLKSLEEPAKNTFFFIINNTSSKISETIKSRCVEYKFHFTTSEKKNIFNNIIKYHELIFKEQNTDKFLYFDTPGNLFKYLLLLNDSNLDISKDHLDCIFYLMEIYKNKSNFELLNCISILIENYYNELSIYDINNINIHFNNKYKISYLINDMRKFNLDKKNLLITLTKILKNEKE